MSVIEQLIKRPGFGKQLLGLKNLEQGQEDLHQRITRVILDSLIIGGTLKDVNVRLWDNSMWPDSEPRGATLVLNRPSALREMLLPGTETGIGEAYQNLAFDIEGDIESAFEMADHIMEKTDGWTQKLELGFLLYQLPPGPSVISENVQLGGDRHSLERDHEAISFHYDVSNDFYALWLDKYMAYSCAYFQHPMDDLETAQRDKFDHICRKLGLQAGQQLLDIGCGWGGLIIHAARFYRVQAEGITLSEQQLEYVQKKIKDERLTDRLSVRLLDYRQMPEEKTYDAIASVGMVEHVGREQLPDYFGKAFRLLKPGGLFLNHGIGLGSVHLPGLSGSFISSHVFPDSDLIRLHDMLRPAESEGWEVRDVESLREHYELTLRHWVRRLEDHHEEAIRIVDEKTYRTWRLYMAGCAHNFNKGRLSIYQTLLAKITENGDSRAPAARSIWYK